MGMGGGTASSANGGDCFEKDLEQLCSADGDERLVAQD